MFQDNIQKEIIKGLNKIIKNDNFTITKRPKKPELVYQTYVVTKNNDKIIQKPASYITNLVRLPEPTNEIFRISKSEITSKLYLYINDELLDDDFNQELLSKLFDKVVQEYNERTRNPKQPTKTIIQRGGIEHQKMILDFVCKHAQNTK